MEKLTASLTCMATRARHDEKLCVRARVCVCVSRALSRSIYTVLEILSPVVGKVWK
jgi:hypothetical protein